MTNSWQSFYNAIRDPQWPDCNDPAEFSKLPANIQTEIIEQHLLQQNTKPLPMVKPDNEDENQPSFLYHLESIKEIIGPKDCQLDMRDAIFLYSMIYSLRPMQVLEIGHFRGWSTSIICAALKDNNCGMLYSVDLLSRIHDQIKNFLIDNTIFISDSSANLLKIPELSNKKFDVCFIDGNHEYDYVINDLEKTFALSADTCYFLLHDADLSTVNKGVDDFMLSNKEIVDCGVLGTKIRVLARFNS